MSSTNKTTNYNLSQYVGSDKPTYLGDYNGDMLKIDTQMKANNTLATNASAAATVAGSAASSALDKANEIGTLSNLVTSEKSNVVAAINEVAANAVQSEGDIGSLSNLTTTDKSNLVGAINELAALLAITGSSQTEAVTSTSTDGETKDITSISLDTGKYLVLAICSANTASASEVVQCFITLGENVSRLYGRNVARAHMVNGGGVTNWSVIQVTSNNSSVKLQSFVKSSYGIFGSICAIKIA